MISALLASGAAGLSGSSADSRAQGSDPLRASTPVLQGGEAIASVRANGGPARLLLTRRGCADARRGLAFYRGRYAEHRVKMGAALSGEGASPKTRPAASSLSCPRIRFLAKRWRAKAYAARVAYERWRAYHYDWPTWLPDKWQRIGACETGYGRRPGDWRWNSGTYQGAFGFYHGSWDAFVGSADRKAGPYPANAYDATPRQQYEVALAIWRRYGFSGWGCRGA